MVGMEKRCAEIRKHLDLFIDPGQITELRAFRGDRTPAASVLYRDLDAMARRAVQLDEESGISGVFFVPNPIKDDVLTPKCPYRKGTANAQLIRERHWLLIDVDAVRVDEEGNRLADQDQPTTDAEREAGWAVLERCRVILEDAGFQGQIVGSSGNCWHLSYPVSLSNDQAAYSSVSSFLAELEDRCGDQRAHIDQKPKDAPRLWKIPGTRARKGKESPGRPWRYSWIHQGTRPTPEVRLHNNACLERLLALWSGQRAAYATPTRSESIDYWITRARAYLEKEDPAIQGQDGSGKCFHVAGVLTQGYLLSDSESMTAIADWNARCQPPWSEGELLHKFNDARNSPCDKPLGYLRTEEPARTSASPLKDPPKDPPKAEPDGLIVVKASAIETRPVEWLWPGRIPVNKLTTFAGVGGLGKTFCLCDIAARVTTDQDWPDGEQSTGAGRVLFVSGEDDPDDTLVPRLTELGANLDRVCFLTSEAQDKFTLKDIPMLERAMDQMGDAVRFIAIDPPTAYLGGTDDHKNGELRQLLTPLKMLASRRRVAIIFNTHINKGGAGKVDAMMRVMGSVAWVNTVRTAHLFARDPDEPSRRFFVPMKMNIGKERKGLSYRIVPTVADLARVEWLGEIETTADQAMNPEPRKRRDVAAAEWLVERFREQLEWPSDDLFRAAKEHGISRSAIFEAKEKLCLPKARCVTGPDGNKRWYWWVPEDWSGFDRNVKSDDEAEF